MRVLVAVDVDTGKISQILVALVFENITAATHQDVIISKCCYLLAFFTVIILFLLRDLTFILLSLFVGRRRCDEFVVVGIAAAGHGWILQIDVVIVKETNIRPIM